MFMSFASLLIARLEQLVNFSNTLFLQASKMRDFFVILDTVPQVAEKPRRVRDPGRLEGRVSFEGVTFAYPPAAGHAAKPAVRDLTFVAQPGETVALVGATGSGKSTTLGLLHRAFDPEGGRITIDGVDIRDLTLEALRRNIGVVFQEPMLFDRSIEDNLRIGKPNATGAEVAVALGARPGRRFRRVARRAVSPRRSASGAGRCRAASASASPSRAPCSRIRRS